MFGRSIDRALRETQERHETFMREYRDERTRFELEMEQRYRDEVRITREVIRRNELVTKQVLEQLEHLGVDIKAHTEAIFKLLDRFQNGGGEAPAA